MKLFYSATSPFVRKVIICAHELGIADQVQLAKCRPDSIVRDVELTHYNPLGQVPTLFVGSEVYYDSGVICRYLEEIAGATLHPQNAMQRIGCLRDQALGDGILDAAVLVRLERTIRPEHQRSSHWERGQLNKVEAGLRRMTKAVMNKEPNVDLSAITFACVLGYLEFRLPECNWRSEHPELVDWFRFWETRPSYVASADLF